MCEVDLVREPVSVDEKSVKRVLEALRDAGKKGCLKAELRKVLADAQLEDDPARMPQNEDAESRWHKALDKRVERCLLCLKRDGAKIVRTPGEGRGVSFVLKKGPAWDENISAEARLALKLASLTLSHSGTALWHEKLEVIERFASNRMSSRDKKLFEQLDQAVKVYGGVDDPVAGTAEDLLAPILDAIQRERMMDIEYQAAGAPKETTLNVAPRAIVHDLFSGGAYLMVWDPKVSQTKGLRLNRISAVKVLKDRAVVQYPEQVQRALDYQIGGWASGEEPFLVKVRIRGRHWISSLREAPPALPEFELQVEAGGKSILVSFKANRTEGPMRWILQFGKRAEVLEPEDLREKMKEELERALEGYDRST